MSRSRRFGPWLLIPVTLFLLLATCCTSLPTNTLCLDGSVIACDSTPLVNASSSFVSATRGTQTYIRQIVLHRQRLVHCWRNVKTVWGFKQGQSTNNVSLLLECCLTTLVWGLALGMWLIPSAVKVVGCVLWLILPEGLFYSAPSSVCQGITLLHS